MYQLVLLRHGESVWNKENLFTGWTDVDLSETGKKEAYNAGLSLHNQEKTWEIAPQFYYNKFKIGRAHV